MMTSRDAADSENDSEFNSAEDEAEFRLYAQLYFEPNPNVVNNAHQSITCAKGVHGMEQQQEQAPKADITQLVRTGPHTVDDHRTREVTSLANPNITQTTDSKVHASKNDQFDNLILIDTLDGSECCLSTFTENVTMHDAEDKSSFQETKQQTSNVSFQDDAPPHKVCALPPQSVRQRLSSTCSDGSIPGSVPLDVLYCNIVTSEEEEEEEIERGMIKEKLMMRDLKALNQERRQNITGESSKRKISESSSEETKDSRCNNLTSVALKNSGIPKGIHVVKDSSSDEDLYVLPPPCVVNHEVVTLELSSDSEPEILNTNVKRIRMPNNKYQKVEKTGRVMSSHRTVLRQKSRKKSEREMYESESESNDAVDLPEAIRGTDLTLNIDTSLSGLIKTITQTPKAKASVNFSRITSSNKQKKSSVKGIRSSLDYTRGRPDTKTNPSCGKWSQSMANFYDSDISDDLDISEIHQQQSGSPGDWQLIPADYQLRQRLRYYNAPERCKQCRQEGHTIKTCPRVPKCHLCSGTDHAYRNKCPKNCCLKCGEDPHFFCSKTDRRNLCALCGYRGHSKELCPDLWRRYHVTTSGLIAQPPNEDCAKPPRERFCYSCGERGHYGHDCPQRYKNIAYVQVPQSVVSYSQPVNLVRGSLVVNTEEAREPLPEKDLTKMFITTDERGLIIGKKGVVVKAISKKTGAYIRIISELNPQVHLLGSAEARLKAQGIIEVLLGQKKSEEYMDFVEHLRTINSSDPPEEQKTKEQSSQEDIIRHNTPSVPVTIDEAAPTATTVDEGDSTIPITKINTPVIANTSQSTTAPNAVVDRGKQNVPWCERFLSSLDGNKTNVLRTIKEITEATFADDGYYDDLQNSLHYVKIFKRQKILNPLLQPTEKLKRHMKNIAMATNGKREYAVRKSVHSQMKCLINNVASYPRFEIPEKLCLRIAKTLECMHDPSVGQLNSLIGHGYACSRAFNTATPGHRAPAPGPEAPPQQQWARCRGDSLHHQRYKKMNVPKLTRTIYPTKIYYNSNRRQQYKYNDNGNKTKTTFIAAKAVQNENASRKKKSKAVHHPELVNAKLCNSKVKNQKKAQAKKNPSKNKAKVVTDDPNGINKKVKNKKKPNKNKTKAVKDPNVVSKKVKNKKNPSKKKAKAGKDANVVVKMEKK